MKDEDRFAGLGAEALSEAERESVVQLALQVLAQKVADGPVMTGERAAARYLQLKVGDREVFGCLFLNTRNRLIRDEEFYVAATVMLRRVSRPAPRLRIGGTAAT